MVLLCLLLFSTYPLYADPVLQVTPESLDFGEVEPYAITITTKQITIANCGDGDSVLCWGVKADDSGWLSVEGDTCGEINLPNGDNKYVQESLGACGLCVVELLEDEDIIGTHTGEFYVYQYKYEDESCTTEKDDSLETNPIIVNVTMTISEFNKLEVNPDELDFGEVVCEDTFEILNTGEGEMEWEAVVSEGADWLTINDGTIASGTNVSGGSSEIAVKVDRSKVEGCADEYNTSIKVTSTNASPSEASVSIIMEKLRETPSPSSPTPDDDSTEQSLYTTLEWWEGSVEDVGGIVYFDVYFSTNQALVDSCSPSVLVCNDLEVPYCDPSKGGGPLEAHTTYYWKVKAIDSCQGGEPYPGDTSDTWSFTTGSEPGPCLASVALQLNEEVLNLLRGFRDEVLVRSLDGERYINLYYSPHAIEALLILLFNPELRMCANRIVKESLPAIQSLLRGERALIDSEIIADIELFLEGFGEDASPGLKRTISIIKEDMATGDLFKSFGFSVVQ